MLAPNRQKTVFISLKHGGYLLWKKLYNTILSRIEISDKNKYRQGFNGFS